MTPSSNWGNAIPSYEEGFLMTTQRFDLRSSVARKLVNGLTGLLAMLFIVAHLAGNLTLLGGPDAFNTYAEALHRLGVLVYVAEVGLVVLFAAHAVSAIQVYLHKRSARDRGYTVARTKGPPSRQTLSSRTMIVTGSVLLVFLIWHIIQFRFGTYYTTMLEGAEVRDLYRLVWEVFQSPVWVATYIAVMILLGFHLRHGFWSAFQSIGLLSANARPFAYATGVVFAIVMAIGFLILPLYMMLLAPEPAVGVAMVNG
jgi:succinate dehydrogenase / fumarate reductase, cytochrome b subunit